MPIYVYKCPGCDKPIEQLQKIADPAPTKCPHCGFEGELPKQVTSAGFQLKGNGYYATDFK